MLRNGKLHRTSAGYSLGNLVAKTRLQLNRHLSASQKLPWPPIGPEWYSGCSSAIAGNSAKVAVSMSSLRGIKAVSANAMAPLTMNRVCGIRTVQEYAPR